jgi:HEXXH motif-containing protein
MGINLRTNSPGGTAPSRLSFFLKYCSVRCMRDVLRGYGSAEEIQHLLLQTVHYRAGQFTEIRQDSALPPSFQVWGTALGGQSTASVLSPPMVGAWIDRVSSEPINSKRRARALQYVGNYAVAAVLRRGMTAELEVPLFDGRLVIPALGCTAILGHGEMAHVATTEDSIVITPDSGTTTTLHYPDLDKQSRIWHPLRHLTADSGKTVVFEDQDPFRDIFRYPVGDGIQSDTEFALWNDLFKEAWEIIHEAHPDFAVGLEEGLHTIVPVGNALPTAALSMVNSQTFGAIAMTTPRNGAGLAAHIVTGFLKNKILAIQSSVNNITVDLNNPLARTTLQPPSREGICRPLDLFQHTYINTGLASFYEAYSRHVTDDKERAFAQLSLARWYDEAQRTIALLEETDLLQENGHLIIRKLKNELATLEPITSALPPTIKRAAEVSAVDQGISWRLHNLAVDTSQTHFPARVIRSNTTPVHAGRQRRYVLRELQLSDPEEFRRIISGAETRQLPYLHPGDRALAAGDIQAARNAYRQAIYDDPQNNEAWAGFALTFHHTPDEPAAWALLERPEVVKAVFTSLGHTATAPEVIAEHLTQVQKASRVDLPTAN